MKEVLVVPKSKGHPGFVFNGHTGEIVSTEQYQEDFIVPDSHVFAVPEEIVRMIVTRNRRPK